MRHRFILIISLYLDKGEKRMFEPCYGVEKMANERCEYFRNEAGCNRYERQGGSPGVPRISVRRVKKSSLKLVKE